MLRDIQNSEVGFLPPLSDCTAKDEVFAGDGHGQLRPAAYNATSWKTSVPELLTGDWAI